MIRKIGIAGAGSFGTAVAMVVDRAVAAECAIALWDVDVERIARLRHTRRNDLLSGVTLSGRISPTADFADLADAEIIFIVTPSFAIREMTVRLADAKAGGILVSCTKGIEHGTRLRMSQILAHDLPGNTVAVLSGPSHAEEMAAGVPTAVALGCENEEALRKVETVLGQPRFHIAPSADCAGIELGGALKNSYAIAAGVVDGLGYGYNTKAAFITYAMQELARLGEAMGGRRETLYGLSGLGDLTATCFSSHSRNRLVGERLACGESLAEISASMTMVAEGVSVTLNCFEYASERRISVPLMEAVYGALYEGLPPGGIVERFL